MKQSIQHAIAIASIGLALAGCQQKPHETKIGVILPLEHEAMNEITEGFIATLKQQQKSPVNIVVKNAQNDPNIQRSIILQMRDSDYDMIVPVGMSATQMSITMVRNKPIVSLAAEISNSDRQRLNPCNVALVHDEISSESIINFFHKMYPQIKHAVLIHSASDKIFPEVKEVVKAGQANGIEIKPLMASSLPELTTAVDQIPNDAEAIIVLKDSLIVSGISTLAKAANQRHIPLMTSDQGSVEEGGGFSIGVHERKIGEEGAKLASAVLNHHAACDLPIVEMKDLTVFVNTRAMTLAFQNAPQLMERAKQSGYSVEIIDKPTGK